MEKIIEKFIPGTNKQYSITSEGIVYKHYNIGRWGISKKIKKPVIKYKQGKTNYPVIAIKVNNKRMYKGINVLMGEIFKIKKPKDTGTYSLINKDGDIFNNALFNLEWKKIIYNKYKFYPQVYYNLKKEITSKCCGECGIIKDIKTFTYKRKGYNSGLRNVCMICSGKKQYNSIKNNSEKYKKSLEYCNYRRRLMVNSYIAKCLKLKTKELTPELVEVYKKSLTLQRQLKNNGKENQNA